MTASLCCIQNHSRLRINGEAGCLLALTIIVLLTSLLSAQHFTNHSHDAGFADISGTNGIALADYDQDGDIDIYFVVKASFDQQDPNTWNRLYRNNNDGTFSSLGNRIELAGRDTPVISSSSMGYKMGASWGDYDNDGWPDLFLTHLGSNQLLKNNGNHTFTDVTATAGVSGGSTQLSSSALWVDLEPDGDLDLYVSNWQDYASGQRDSRNWLYLNNGDGTFTESATTSGVDDDGATWTTVALDGNSDGKLDLYLANDFGRNKFYLNRGDMTFEEKTLDHGLEDPYHGMGVTIGDYNNDLSFDIYLTNITESGFGTETNPLFVNSGSGIFQNLAAAAGIDQAGWGWGTEFFDLENDGDEDLFVATGYINPDYVNRLFENVAESGTLVFEDISSSAAIADSAAARGMAAFDYEGDGDIDILVSNIDTTPYLYQNRAAQGNWLKVALEGTLSNRDGFGSIIELTVDGATYRKYHHGAQFLGQNILPVHFGIADAQVVDHLQVFWPNGQVDEATGVAANQTVRMRENVGIVTAIEVSEAGSAGAFQLAKNFPNPFNGSTFIQFDLPAGGEVQLTILNLLGQVVYVHSERFANGGAKTLRWDGVDNQGNTPASGVYLYQLKYSRLETVEILSGKMLYLK